MNQDTPGSLRLLVEDVEDLAIVSAHLQDMVIRARDMAFLPKSRRFAIAGARFDWLAAEAGRMERCHVGLHFEGVLGAATTGFDPAGEGVLNLLSIVFEPGEPPGGEVLLTFSGGAAVRLVVECLDAQLRDLGPRWQTKNRPGHAGA